MQRLTAEESKRWYDRYFLRARPLTGKNQNISITGFLRTRREYATTDVVAMHFGLQHSGVNATLKLGETPGKNRSP